MERWLQGFLVPMVSFLVTASLIVGIGMLLLALPHNDVAHLGDTPVLLSSVVAFAMGLIVLIGCALAAAGGNRAQK
jgi:hypothetical protein